MFIFVFSACAPQLTATPAPPPALTEATQIPVTELPTVVDQSVIQKSYTNSAFGLGFQFPSSWFGPEEYISDQDLHVEVGSDRVYSYGTDPAERIYELKNSYNVVIQYSKNNQNQYWKDTYQSLLNMKDGESLSDGRSMVIRIGQLNLGDFDGIEYVSTLSETAQTEPVYVRQVILFNDQSNDLLTIMGQPNNVEINGDASWREVYRMIDEENLAVFHEIVESVTVNPAGASELDKIIDVALRGNTDELK